MALTLTEIDQQIADAYAALAAIVKGQEASFSVENRSSQFHSPSEIRHHIDWLKQQRAELVEEMGMDADGVGSCPVVRFEEPSA